VVILLEVVLLLLSCDVIFSIYLLLILIYFRYVVIFFIADYLHLMHGYSHVDGDGPVKNCHIPRNKELTIGMFTNGMTYIGKGEDGVEELWQPYQSEIAKDTIEAAKNSDKVVLSHATYRQTHREYTVDQLVEGGATRENITILQLMVDPEVKLKGSFYRTKEQSENAGITMGDNMRTHGWEGVGDGTLAEYVKFMKETMPDHAGNDAFVDIPNGYGETVDVSGRDMTHLDGVDEALGLVGKRNNTTLTKFEEIRDKVKTYEQVRDENMAANGAHEIFNKIFKEVLGGDDIDDENENDDADADAPIDKEEQDKIAKRRSSLIAVKYLERDLRRSSLESSSSDEKKQIMKARRSSLIKIGKIDLEEYNDKYSN